MRPDHARGTVALQCGWATITNAHHACLGMCFTKCKCTYSACLGMHEGTHSTNCKDTVEHSFYCVDKKWKYSSNLGTCEGIRFSYRKCTVICAYISTTLNMYSHRWPKHTSPIRHPKRRIYICTHTDIQSTHLVEGTKRGAP